MEKDGLLVSKEDVTSGRKKIYYKATKKGNIEFEEIKMKIFELYKEIVEDIL